MNRNKRISNSEQTLTAEEVKQEQLALPETEAQVIVHCALNDDLNAVRIWPTTYLICAHTGAKSKLIDALNISFYPDWCITPSFTLLFESLPKDCKLFHLVEEIPEQGGFEVNNISRNNSDVYRVVF